MNNFKRGSVMSMRVVVEIVQVTVMKVVNSVMVVMGVADAT
jgi:hypothetical protein